MTLLRQLTLAVLVLFLILYAGNVGVSLYQTKYLVEEQMAVHAQDTATSVAISMTQAAIDEDVAKLDALFNAVSDRGYYQRIYFLDIDGNVVLERNFPISIEGVPDWFVKRMAISPHEGRAEVAAGWTRLGEVAVVSNPGQAYLELWEVTLQQLGWFAVVTLAVCLLAAVALKWLLRPLQRIEEQAEAICEKDFRVQNELPRTRELRRVVEAMNRMSLKLRQIFESQLDMIRHLREQSFRDRVTGLSNRADFDARLNSYTNREQGPVSGVLMLLGLDDLAAINEKAGRTEGNALLKKIGQQITKACETCPQAIIARRQGPEFSIFVPEITREDVRTVAERVLAEARKAEWLYQDTAPLVMHLGYSYHEQVESGPEILGEADMALNQARSLSSPGCCDYTSLQDKAPVVSRSNDEWRELLETAIANKSFSLIYQPVFGPDRTPMAHEVFSRLVDDDNLISAGIFAPLAGRFGLAEQLDRIVLECFAGKYQELSANGFFVLNLCSESATSGEFTSWLNEFLIRNSRLANNLVLEISEGTLKAGQRAIRELAEMLAYHGSSLSLDHFGLETASFGYLSSLPLRYLKVHRSYVRNVDGSEDNQFYIRSLIQIAKTRDVELFVEGVETEAEWETLKSLGIDAAQGYYLASPASNPVPLQMS